LKSKKSEILKKKCDATEKEMIERLLLLRDDD